MSLEKEILRMEWRPVYLGGQQTSYIIARDGTLMNTKTRQIRKWNSSDDGYMKCTISFNGHNFKVSKHRLVALAFIPNPDNKPEVNHKDGDKKNNWDWNLEWVTSSENTKHAIELGLKWFYGSKGESNPNNVYTENQIRRACKMMENPINRPITISKITGVSRITLYKIRKGESWNHVACEYEFPLVNFIIGENNCNNKYSDDQIHNVCEYLETQPKMSSHEISNITGVGSDVILRIRSGKLWRHISMYYEFPHVMYGNGENHPNAVYTDAQIHQVCKMLEDPYVKYPFISNFTGVSISTIGLIFKKKQWVYISKYYNFPESRRDKKSDRIIELYNSGKSSIDITTTIMSEFGLVDRRKTNLSVLDIINRYKHKLLGSSTIDQLCG